MTTLYVFLVLMGVLTLLVPAVSIFLRSKKDKQKLKAYFENGVRHGRAAAIAEMEKIREDRGVGYRESAMIAGKKCASCERKCIHCARQDADVSRNIDYVVEALSKVDPKKFDEAEADDLYVHHVKEQERTANKVKVSRVSKQLLEAGKVRFEEGLVMPEESALLWGEKKKERTAE